MKRTTERLIIRALCPDDEPFFAAYHNHPNANRHQDPPCPPERIPEEFQCYLKADLRLDPLFCLAVTTHRAQCIGLVYYSLSPTTSIHTQTPATQIGSIGVIIAPESQNQGFATEACSAVVQFCFQERKVGRLTMGCYASNPASRRVIQKLGFYPISPVLRETLIRKGKIDKTELWHELTYREWLKHRIATLERRLAQATK